MKSTLLVAGLLVIVSRAAEDATRCLPTITYYAEPDLATCPLYKCAPTPTITYTTTASATVTSTIPCETYYTIGPVPVTDVKRADSEIIKCPPIWTTKPCPGGCPTTTTAYSTVVTSTTTFTKYKLCPTKTPITTIKPTTLPSTITGTPKPTSVSSTTKKPTTSCSYRCSLPSGPATIYDAEPTALAAEVICLQACPLYTLD